MSILKPISALALTSAFLLSTGCGSTSTTGVSTDAPDPKPGDGPVLPSTPLNYANPEIPAHFFVESEGMHGQLPLMDSDNTPASNPTTDAGATLGRVLFYDVNMSANRTVSCASCHIQEKGFSDDRVLSLGFEEGETGRHSMGLTNARFYREGRFFWDQRAATLEEQVLMPFQDPVEMGMTLASLESRANEASYYPALFESAFGDPEITTERMSLALAQFVRSMISTQSKYDTGRAMVSARSSDFPNFSESENLGKFLFVAGPGRGGFGCFVCHQGEGFIAQSAQSNGLDATTESDLGYGGVTELAQDEGTFKVPSLRNVGLRAPYMHDGRFATLEDVVAHYSDGVQASPNLGPPFFPGVDGVAQIEMTQQEKNAMVAFLLTLTDDAIAADPKFSDPFVSF
jgi:cytochrome c peroxidase